MTKTKERNWIVRTPMGSVWAVRFATAEAAWRRVVRPMQRKDEGFEAAQERAVRAGWKVQLT